MSIASHQHIQFLLLDMENCFYYLQKLANIRLNWKADYAQVKFIPVLTRWHLIHSGAECDFRVTTILKKRNLRGVESYEVQWSGDELSNVTTVEPVELVAKVYPKLHEQYILSKLKPKRGEYLYICFQ